jgi:hypothetical protein
MEACMLKLTEIEINILKSIGFTQKGINIIKGSRFRNPYAKLKNRNKWDRYCKEKNPVYIDIKSLTGI